MQEQVCGLLFRAHRSNALLQDDVFLVIGERASAPTKFGHLGVRDFRHLMEEKEEKNIEQLLEIKDKDDPKLGPRKTTLQTYKQAWA